MPGLTGLRGVAVAAVVAYHLGHLPGGFIGVDLFFVLSGFLITSLLLDDPPSSATHMLRWWARRVRRLAPAVAVTVLAVAIAFATTSGVAMDGLATLTWWQNWHLVLEGSSYWEGAASPLRHAWSLSIEEQFYVLWPPALAGLAALARRSGPAAAKGIRLGPGGDHTRVFVGAVAATGALISFARAAVMAGGADVDLSRIYYGTDTRVGTLLVGCTLATVLHGRPARPTRGLLSAAALVACAVLVVLSVVITPSESWTYRGGLTLTAAAAAVVVAAASRSGLVTTGLEWAPLQWLGVRSYAIYLWSWPTQVFVETRFTSWGAPLVASVTVATSLLLAHVSLRLVEEPLRHGSSWASAVRPRRVAWVAGAALAAVSLVVAAHSAEPTVEEQLAEEFERQPDPTAGAGVPSCEENGAPDWEGGTSGHDPATVEQSEDPDEECAGVRLLVVGDSTGRGAANGLRRSEAPGVQVWDRTELGCGLVPPGDECADWRRTWSEAIEEVDPDVVLVYLGVSGNLVPGDDPPFLSEEASRVRRSQVGEAIDLLGSGSARVVWSLPPVPLESGVFYCGGAAEDTPCDADWVDRWHDDVRAVAADRGAATVDVRAWIAARPDTADADRPDGLHLSGPALDAHAGWLLEEMEPAAK